MVPSLPSSVIVILINNVTYWELEVWIQVQSGVGLMGWVNIGPRICLGQCKIAFEGHEVPFSRLALAVHCDESSMHLKKDSFYLSIYI